MASEYVLQRGVRDPQPPEGRAAQPSRYDGGQDKPVPPAGRPGTEAGTDGKPMGFLPAQRRLHWIVAGLVVVQLTFGMWIGAVSAQPGNAELLSRLFAVHGGTGALIFVLMLARLRLRRDIGVPPPTPGTPALAAMLARLNHHAFYVLLLALPVIGWFALGAHGVPLSLFGILDLPAPIAADHDSAVVLGRMHGGLALLLVAAIAAHLAGVVYHTRGRRDGTLQRMSL